MAYQTRPGIRSIIGLRVTAVEAAAGTSRPVGIDLSRASEAVCRSFRALGAGPFGAGLECSTAFRSCGTRSRGIQHLLRRPGHSKTQSSSTSPALDLPLDCMQQDEGSNAFTTPEVCHYR